MSPSSVETPLPELSPLVGIRQLPQPCDASPTPLVASLPVSSTKSCFLPSSSVASSTEPANYIACPNAPRMRTIPLPDDDLDTTTS
ncbi:hypothetical protein BDY19DRAFT_992022 [Irpex rosettiformis]|uniref:Uncharacterized protein n=1 Tax=Irpex rosettiformis TaxID=378272 RepID=A0ACB8U8A5_9APHY|nr:hypothetical protein BDY19DRAFT_992022 [Irpex rosettiformis]